jgi:hypothetical protein
VGDVLRGITTSIHASDDETSAVFSRDDVEHHRLRSNAAGQPAARRVGISRHVHERSIRFNERPAILYVFNAGGTMTESSNYDGAPPVPPAYGVWKTTGENKFQLKYIFYITKPPTKFDELVGGQGWLPTGHGVITEDITLSADKNSWDSKIHWDAFDMNGKPVMGGGDGTTHGTRINF